MVDEKEAHDAKNRALWIEKEAHKKIGMPEALDHANASAISEGSLSLAEKVSPASSLTTDHMSKVGTKRYKSTDATRMCSGCQKEREWSHFSKTQWLSHHLTRKCKLCLEGQQAQHPTEKDLSLLTEKVSSDSLVAEHAYQQEVSQSKFQVEQVQSANLVSNGAATAPKGILKPAHDHDHAKRNVVVKEESQDCDKITNAVVKKEETDHGDRINEPVDQSSSSKVGIKYSHTDNTRMCSKCNKEREWSQFSKTQWLSAAMQRKCKTCLQEDKNENEASKSEDGCLFRQYEGSIDLRRCSQCNMELEWHKFSKRQWTAKEIIRKCRQCVNNINTTQQSH
jgi:hypothetical protein